MRVKTWKVLDWGRVPPDTPTAVPLTCQCGREAHLPVLGRAIAQLAGGGIIFDPGDHAIPATVQCRHCLRILTVEEPIVR